MDRVKYVVLGLAGCLLLGYAIGRYAQPAKVVTKTEIVVKTVETVKHDTVTVTKEHQNTDGTKDVVTTITDHDIEQTTKDIKEKDSKVLDSLKPQWKATGLYGYNFHDLRTVYGASVDRRIIGPVFAGVWGNTDRTAGVSVSLEF